MDPKVERRLRKLQALAERGVDGEKETAQRMLDTLLAKHGIAIEDLAGDAREMQWFKYRGKFYRRLLVQVIGVVCGNDRDCYTSPGYRSCIGAEVTTAEQAEILVHFDAYSKSLEQQFETAFSAFLHRHCIFPEPVEDDEEDDVPLDQDLDLERLKRVAAMMEAMPDVEVRPALDGNRR